MFDLVVGASSIYGGSWLEGAGAVYAENEALRWIADLAGLPPAAGGVFVPGGTIGNLSALVAARAWRGPGTPRPAAAARGPRVAAQSGAHSSIQSRLRRHGRRVGRGPGRRPAADRAALRRCSRPTARRRFFAVVATAGTTNFGIVDDLASVAEVCREFGIWFHVDGAYGGAGLAAPSVRHLFAGIEHADSFIVDPHKWLFAPFDCCALLYREPALARAAHTQHAGYLDVLTDAPTGTPPTTPSASPAGPAACRSGSPSPSTAPTPTPPRSSAPSRWPGSRRRRSRGGPTSSCCASPTCR